ncbi:MAG: dihydroorotate dehydrogenase electron transfer subunit [Gammaproteobacteria bacterium]
MTLPERASIDQELATVRSHTRYPGSQHVLSLHAPQVAARAQPGSFVHVDCGREWLLRRPMSIMSADAEKGEIELLFKTVGHGTRTLAALEPGDPLDMIGPIGNAFTDISGHPTKLLLGGGVGIPPMIFYAETLVTAGAAAPWVITGSELPFPFATGPARLDLPGAPGSATHALQRLEARGIPNRLASLADLDGCFHGYVTGLAEALITALPAPQQREVALYACGPTPMLAAVAALARQLELPCQVSLEEYMACGVGGCAGCTVEVDTPSGAAMKRVCVDGPVFDAATVFTATPIAEPAETPFD